ncbi:hypothetical protein [Thermoleophilum album]|uniref:Uncharacterized protein n=1 Tax=Thermoleophilum album TaxID=29539 RepID=A0A1H6FIY7_THEAL|nr:hypothetical protein [Thermoleophilum album]SEH10160.1 hypothetical protein SAMN02745716_0006 [Thermoleophilum album]
MTGQRLEPLALPLPAELIDHLAERVAEILAERRQVPDDGWLRGADAIARYIDAPRSRVYALASCTPPRIPVHRDGSALIARKSELDDWLRNGGGRRP